MGMMIFIMASGLTLVFGLMDVLNFGHGAFIAVGAYVATPGAGAARGFVQADSLLAQSRGAGAGARWPRWRCPARSAWRSSAC